MMLFDASQHRLALSEEQKKLPVGTASFFNRILWILMFSHMGIRYGAGAMGV